MVSYVMSCDVMHLPHMSYMCDLVVQLDSTVSHTYIITGIIIFPNYSQDHSFLFLRSVCVKSGVFWGALLFGFLIHGHKDCGASVPGARYPFRDALRP